MKNLVTFENYQLNSDLRIADSDAFKELVKKHNLKIITSAVQDKHNTVMVEMPMRIKQSENSDTKRVYVMYSNGYIRGESGNKWSNDSDDKPSQYVIAKYNPIKTEADIVKMVDRLDQTLTANFKIMQDFAKWKTILKNDPSRYTECPLSILNLINSSQHTSRKQLLMAKYRNIYQQNPTFTTKIPLYYLEKIDRDTAEKKKWYLKVKRDPSQISNIPSKFAPEIIVATHPKLKNVAKFGIFDKED